MYPNVLFLTHYFPPEVGAAQARIARLASGLQTRRMGIRVHTGFPHYPDGRVLAPYRNRPWLHEELDGLPILRTAVYPSPNRGVVRRLAGHAAFAAGAVALQRRGGDADVVVAETPPLFTAAAAVPYARRKGAALILNVADRWPASVVALGVPVPRAAVAAAERLERWCYRAATAIIVPTASMARILDRLPEASGKVETIGPGVDPAWFAGEPPPRRGGPLRVLYAGTVGLAHGLETLVDAARIAGPDVVQVTIAGGGAELAALRARPAPNVELLGVVAAQRVPDLYASADAGVVLLRDVPLLDEALPTKLLEVMAAARPVLICARGESAAVVREAGAGVVVAPGDGRALAGALHDLAADRDGAQRMGAAGRRYVCEHFTADRQLDRWAALISRAAASPRSGRAYAARRRAG